MAEIFEAQPEQGAPEGLPERLVVKRLLSKHTDNSEFVRLFQREAELMRRMANPGIVQIFDVGEDEGQHFIAMEYVPGRDLRRIATEGVKQASFLPLELAVRAIADVAEALEVAHNLVDDDGQSMGLVHRDICPHNILLSWDGEVKLTDFGIARAVDQASGVPAGQLSGRVSYLSPEQVQGIEVDRRSDLFSLGVVLYEITVGTRLFKKGSEIETLQAVQEGQVAPPSEVREGYPEALEHIVMRALAREPGERYVRAGALARDLRQFVESLEADSGAEAMRAYLAALYPNESPHGAPAAAEPPVGEEEDDDERPTRPSAAAPIPDELEAEQGEESPSHPEQMSPSAGDDDEGSEEAEGSGKEAPESAEADTEDQVPADWPDPEGWDLSDSEAATPSEPLSPNALAAAAEKTEAEDQPSPSPRKRRRGRAISRVHKVPEIGEENPEDVYLSLEVKRRGVLGYGGLLAAALVLLGGGSVWFMQGVRSDEQEALKSVSDDRKAIEEEATKPEIIAKPDVSLTVQSTPPDAEVIIDLVPLSDRTPLTVPVLSQLHHSLRVHKAGFLPHVEHFRIEKGKSTLHKEITLKADPGKTKKKETGTVILVSDPEGAEVYMGGERRGHSPLTLEELPSDRLQVAVLRSPGLTPHVIAFTADAGLETMIRTHLAPSDVDLMRRDLKVETVPSDAIVLIDNKEAGISPLLKRFPKGKRMWVEVRKEGHEPFLSAVSLGEASLTIRANLPRKPTQYGYLSLRSTPRATVYIDNSEVGRTPLKRFKLEAGKPHTVVVDSPKHRGSFSIKVEADEALLKRVSWDKDGSLKVE